MRFIRAGIILTLLGGAPVLAQTQITPDAFLDQAVGQTLTFSERKSGQVVGVEQFLNRNQSVWAAVNLRCTYGKIEVRGPLICFTYEDYPNPENCWMPFMDDTGLIVMSRTFDIQRITAITKDPVICENAPLS